MRMGTLADSFGLLRKSRRVRSSLIALVVVLAIASIPLIWHLLALRGLPDVGDPFDVENYGHDEVADKDNAFLDYSIASTMLTRSRGYGGFRGTAGRQERRLVQGRTRAQDLVGDQQGRARPLGREPRNPMRFMIGRR